MRDKLIMLDIRPGELRSTTASWRPSSGFGRTPVREAMKRLEIDHLVISYPRRGTFATIVDITELADVSETTPAAGAARRPQGGANRANAAMRAELCAAGPRNRGAGPTTRPETHDLMRYDLTVHRPIYRAAGNPHLEDTLIRLDNLATRIWCLVLDKVPSVAGHITEHVELLDAIVDGDADRASSLALEHSPASKQPSAACCSRQRAPVNRPGALRNV